MKLAADTILQFDRTAIDEMLRVLRDDSPQTRGIHEPAVKMLGNFGERAAIAAPEFARMIKEFFKPPRRYSSSLGESIQAAIWAAYPKLGKDAVPSLFDLAGGPAR